MNKKESKKKFAKNLDIIVFALIAVVIGIIAHFGLNDKLDYRFYDMFLHLKKNPKQSEKIVLCEIDDQSITSIGPWPWSRDIMADCLLHMKELGAERAVFDIEYLSHSQKTVNENFSNKTLDEISSTKNAFNSYIDSYTNEIFNEKEWWKTNKLRNDFKKGINDGFKAIEESYSSSFNDNDLYFQQALMFFGNSWLTVNTRDINIEGHDTPYVNEVLLLSNIKDEKNLIEKNNVINGRLQKDERDPGFTPALPEFIQHANGLGFTNVNIDSDGVRRRIELLHKHNDKYAGQLVFAPLLNFIDCKEIERKNNSLILKNVIMPGEPRATDVKIPLDNKGSMLINWRHGDFASSFKHVPLSRLYNLERIEKNILNDFIEIVTSLEITDQNANQLPYRTVAENLLKEYQNLLNEKDKLLTLCIPGFETETGVSSPVSPEMYSHYFNKRFEFFKKVTNYSNNLYESEIYEALFGENALLDISEIEKQSMWMQLVGDFSPEEINQRIWNTWTPEEFYENEYRFGALTFLYDDIETYNAESSILKTALKDGFCIMGETASSTTDMGATPFVNRYANVGTHANVLNTILQQDFIRPLSGYWVYAAVFVLFGLVIVLTHNLSRKIQNIIGGITLGAVIIIPILSMAIFSIYIPYVNALFFSILVYLSGTIIRFVNSSKEKEFIKLTFSQFVSPDVVNLMIANPDMARLGGEKKIVTALFSDIQKFSTLSEKYNGSLDPKFNVESLIVLLNEYLGTMSDVILDNKGTIDKYIGDSIVSLFGAPLEDKFHAFHALESAIKMKQVESEFNKRHMLAGDIPNELFTRIGINTGEMIVGNMGTENKKNYTMMGDNVNLASRLEGVNKAYKSWILCSEDTWKEANRDEHKNEIIARKLDMVRVVGKSTPTQLYNIVGFRSEMSRIQIEEIGLFEEALDKYLAKKFTEAGKMFLQANELIPEDKVALVFADRCKTNIQSGVPDDWDGILNLTTK